ncbi:cyclic nucleotide-binding domain-containing protein [Oceanospirillum sanctuarii]|uniref:cyclic nucleotide-binding domain-containing protein n=1 Tax=Oceanospirillum sanctuarii TaxID=1434821 RepID=UPI000A3CE2B3|nr:cyclic nucleotide-binding domain-containing protein [Oceanospirillum sanctuarii]
MKGIRLINRVKILNILDKIDFFSAFNPGEKNMIVDTRSRFVAADKGENIIVQGERDSAFYILLHGSAHVSLEENGKKLADLQPGDFFGEVSFLTNTPRTSNVVADETCILFRFDKKVMHSLPPLTREKIKDKIIAKLVNLLAAKNESHK